MKKKFIIISSCLMAILTLPLTACGDNNNETYYPTNEEMKTNLEKKGYDVEVYDDIQDHEFFMAFSSVIEGTALEALKDEDYIYYFHLASSWRCDTVYDVLNERCENYDTLVKIENDEKFGNIVYCGTKNAISASGINVVEIKVKV